MADWDLGLFINEGIITKMKYIKITVFCLFVCLFSSCRTYQKQDTSKFNSISEFYFHIGGHRNGVRAIEIIKYENQIIAFFYPFNEMREIYAKTEMDNIVFNNFIYDLSLIRIDKWKNFYNNPYLMDGEGWKISIKFDDKHEPINKSGYSNYPEGWDEFMKMIINYFPKMDQGIHYSIKKDENTGDNIIMESWSQKNPNSKYRDIISRPFGN